MGVIELMLMNPFAMKDGKMICIADLSTTERGLKCNCKCVACEAPLIARMGNVNEHHFAHSQKLCDEGQAYIQGMYQLAKEILETSKYITLPGLKIAYRHSISPQITLENISHHIRLIPADTLEEDQVQYILLFEQMTIPITETYIKYKHNKNIEALIVTSNKKELAIKIALPPTVCKDYKSKPVKGLSTLEIDFMNKEYELNILTRKEFSQMIVTDVLYKSWISNLKVTKVYDHIIEENDRFIETYKKKQEEKRAKRKAWEEDQRKIRQQELKTQLLMKPKAGIPVFSSSIESLVPRKEQIEKGYEEIVDKFDKESTEIIRDSFGNRWVYCILCHRIKHVDEMGMYGGMKPNIGKCNACFR